MKLSVKVLLALLATITINPALANGPSNSNRAPKATLVETAVVANHQLQPTLNLVGKLEATQSVVISPEGAGRIEAIKVTNNQNVEKDEILVVLDTANAEMLVKELELTLAEEKRILGEYERLVEKKAITQTSYAGQQAKVEIAEVKLAGAKHSLDQLYVKAPFKGTTGFIDFSRGKMVSSSTELFTIDDLSVMYVDIHVPEKYLQQIQSGLNVSATSQAWPGIEFSGELDAIDTRINPETLNMTARVEFTNTEQQLKPGMLMNVELEFSPIQQPIIPVQALEYSGSKRFVYLVNEDNRVARTEVTLGDRINEQVAITSGINIGDRVVVTGTVNMRDGLLVKDVSETLSTAMLGE